MHPPPVLRVMTDDKRHPTHPDPKPKEKAAHGSGGQNQAPDQARKDSSTTWDTDQHSSGPGPFGTGDE